MTSSVRRLAAVSRITCQAMAATAATIRTSGNELQRLLVMFQQHELGHRARKADCENAEHPEAQEPDRIRAHPVRFHGTLLVVRSEQMAPMCLDKSPHCFDRLSADFSRHSGTKRWVSGHYGLLRASFITSARLALYLAMTSLTKAVTLAASGFSGISACSISIMPFSMAT